MRATDLLTLPAGVILRPAETVERSISERLDHNPGDFVLTRPGSRSHSLLIDAAAAHLLQHFQQPRTLVDVIIHISRNTGVDPDTLLAQVLPLVGHLRGRRLLVVAGSEEARQIEPTLAPSSSFRDVWIDECVHVFEDVEVYRVVDRSGRHRGLKILRPECDLRAARALDQEVAILERLDGMHVPRVLASGEQDGRRFVMTSWSAGLDVGLVAQTLRGTSPSSIAEVARLCTRVLRAYASLHDAAVLHGDIHPGNIKVGSDGLVIILDFALGSCAAGDPTLPPLGRGGIAEFVEPEYCKAVVLGKPSPPVTAFSEQYALGALCFLLLTGAHYLQFSFQQEAWLTQVIENPPRSFFACGGSSWSAVEGVLAKALRKDPAARFDGVAEFADELERASRTARSEVRPQATRNEFLEHLARRFSPTRKGMPSLVLRASSCTVNHGAAGVAYFYYRLAGIRDDPGFATTADLWSSWARAHVDQPDALPSEELQSTPADVRPASLFHGPAGIECVDALVRQSAGDNHAASTAARRFIAAAGQRSDSWDVAFGRAGLLLGCAALIEALSTHRLAESGRGARDEIAALGDQLASTTPPSRGAEAGAQSFAHGRVGAAFAGLRWYEATGQLPPWLRTELDELADTMLWGGTTPRWPIEAGHLAASSARRTSWCQGAAGHALLWNLADRCFPEGPFAPLAEAAATVIWEGRDAKPVNGSLCCGYAGQGYALLARYRRSGDRRWLARAEALCERAVTVSAKSRSSTRASLYKGDIGIALLAGDLQLPEGSCMPLVEAEGWRSG